MKKFFSDNQVQRFNKCSFWANFGDFDTTRPPEMAKNWSHGAAWQTKIWKKYLTKNISYKKLHLKKFRVNIRSKHKGIWVFLPKMAKFWPKKGQFWIFDKRTFFYIYKVKASWEKSEKSDASLWKYEQKTLILGYFGQFWTIFGQKRANFEFSAKKRNCHFFTVTESRVHEKNQKNLMRGFLRKSGRTYGRTDVRTDVRTSVNP